LTAPAVLIAWTMMPRGSEAGLVCEPPPRAPGASVVASADHRAALAEAGRLAAGAGRGVSTVDILIGMVRTGGAAARLLAERGLPATTVEVLAAKVRPEQGLDEAAVALASHEIALGLGGGLTTSLHLLLALLRSGGSATEALRLAGVEPAKLRGMIMRALTGHDVPIERKVSRRAVPASARGAGERPAAPPRASQPQADSAATATPSSSLAPAEPSPTGQPQLQLVPLDLPRAPVLHRERELGRLLDLLQAKTARVIAIVGEPGSGRSALLAALAAASLEPPVCPSGDMGAPASPGALLQALHRSAPAGAALVLEGAAWLGPEGSDGILQLLALATSGRRFLLALTPADLRRFELTAPDLANALETVVLTPPEPATLAEMVDAGLDAMTTGAGPAFATGVTPVLLRLAARYPSDRAHPGRALGIAEVALARAQRLGSTVIAAQDIAAVVGDASGVPPSQLLRDDDDRFRTLEDRLAERVVGHAEARGRIASVLRRSYAGFRGHRPLASLLLLGPTGVGKTETARAIAEALFDGESAMVRIDLSEYSEPHAIARLIGAPPGYLAHEDGGQLTEAIRRRPASVVLLDELEKAHREVLLVLLQVLEDGRLTDGRGRTVDFSAAAVVMTSNLGSECYRRTRAPAASTITALARTRLPPELWNRIDEILCYGPLGEPELAAIVERIARESSRRLQNERGIAFAIDDSVVGHVLRTETDRSLGARPLRRAFERLVEGPLAMEIVTGRIQRGARLRIGCDRAGALVLTSMLG
jgi:ATP-dependent Clp protease ATP-binding subunit ClpC